MLDANSHKSKDITSSSQSMIQSNFSFNQMTFLIDDLARSAQKYKGNNNKLGGMRSNPNAQSLSMQIGGSSEDRFGLKKEKTSLFGG